MTPDAVERLRSWLPPNEDPVRPLMQLATVDGAGVPDVRSVLLSEWDEAGFVLHTDARSRKVGQIAVNPVVAIVLAMPDAGRQLSVQGTAEPAGPERDARAYARRTPYLRRLAWVNTAELANAAPGEREAAWERFGAAHDDGDLSAPATWLGLVVRPTRLTFWEAFRDGPSHRTEYRRGSGAWSSHELPG